MNSSHFDLKTCQQGQTVEVSLSGNAANVLLLDTNNLQHYKNGRKYEYFGGHMTTSISRLPIPRTGHWHVLVNLGGHGGKVRSSVRVI